MKGLTVTAILLCLSLGNTNTLASNLIAEVLISRLDGNTVFIDINKFKYCLMLITDQGKEKGFECMEKQGVDTETFTYLIKTSFSNRISYYDVNGHRAINPPPNLYSYKPLQQGREYQKGGVPQNDSSFSIERVHTTSDISVEVIVKPQYRMRLECSVKDREGNILTVESQYVDPPVDRVLILTQGDTYQVSSATCWQDN